MNPYYNPIKVVVSVPSNNCSADNFVDQPAFKREELDAPGMRKLVQRYIRHTRNRISTKWGANFHIANQIRPLLEVPNAAFIRIYLVAESEAGDPDPDNSNRAGNVTMVMTVTDSNNNVLTSRAEAADQYIFQAECCGNPPGNARFANDPFMNDSVDL